MEKIFNIVERNEKNDLSPDSSPSRISQFTSVQSALSKKMICGGSSCLNHHICCIWSFRPD